MTTTMADMALFSKDGVVWQDGTPLAWERNDAVTKIVLGTLERDGNKSQTISLTQALPSNLAELYPRLTHLHLWGISTLETLPELPAGLNCLDVRSCEHLRSVPEIPLGLETLVINGTNQLTAIPSLDEQGARANNFSLEDVSLADCRGLPDAVIDSLLTRTPRLRLLNLSGSSFKAILHRQGKAWPKSLADIRLDRCERLRFLPEAWPHALRRLGLRRAGAIAAIPDLPTTTDYVDLAYTKALEKLPGMPVVQPGQSKRPRTLFLYGSGVPLAPDLYGDDDSTNVSSRVLADLDASKIKGRVADHEVKVILLGDGRSGKSSLARAWIDRQFDPEEPSTHCIRLWKQTIWFKPVDDAKAAEAHLNIWDFAGQDLYHSTHRLFLQSRAVFIICHTDHPYGADPATDMAEAAAMARDGEDVHHRRLGYWLDQVRSLGTVPGLGIEPPILVVRTKADRDVERDVSASVAAHDHQVPFSAKSRQGLTEIEDWVEAQVSTLLGKWDARSLPTQAAEVKAEFKPLIEANERAYWEAEKSGKLIPSPHPTIARAEFDRIVRDHCTGEYHDHPLLLLERFHRTGFLYYSREHLPESIIIDQRWAIQGIYAFSSRSSRYNIRERLKESDGQFFLSELSEYSWTPAGYDEAAQHLFLSFMLSCGMCFELLRPNESQSGRSLYAAPGFFPTRAQALRRYPELTAGPGDAWTHIALDNVTEPEVRSLLSSLGAEWSRSMDAWQWGCRLTAASSEAVCLLDWPRGEGSYFGTLKIWLTGPEDRRFETFLRERVHRTLNDPMYSERGELDRRWPKGETHDDWRAPDRPDVRDIQSGAPFGSAVLPRRDRAVGIRVSVSYAGASADEPHLHLIPTTLARRLKAEPAWIREVAEYQSDVSESDLRRFLYRLTSLAHQDYVLCFLSPKYLQSAYCMMELYTLYTQPPVGRFPYGRVQLNLFPGTGLDRAEGHSKDSLISWKEFWRKCCREREQAALDKFGGNWDHAIDHLHNHAAHAWYAFVEYQGDRDVFAAYLVHYRWYKSLGLASSQDEAERAVDDLMADLQRKLADPEVLIEQIAAASAEGRVSDGTQLYFRLRCLRPDYNVENDDHRLRSEPESEPLLEGYRKRAIEVLVGSDIP